MTKGYKNEPQWISYYLKDDIHKRLRGFHTGDIEAAKIFVKDNGGVLVMDRGMRVRQVFYENENLFKGPMPGDLKLSGEL